MTSQRKTLKLILWEKNKQTNKQTNKHKHTAVDKHFQGHTPLFSKNSRMSSLSTENGKPPMQAVNGGSVGTLPE